MRGRKVSTEFSWLPSPSMHYTSSRRRPARKCVFEGRPMQMRTRERRMVSSKTKSMISFESSCHRAIVSNSPSIPWCSLHLRDQCLSPASSTPKHRSSSELGNKEPEQVQRRQPRSCTSACWEPYSIERPISRWRKEPPIRTRRTPT